jgi:hypothetical protein
MAFIFHFDSHGNIGPCGTRNSPGPASRESNARPADLPAAISCPGCGKGRDEIVDQRRPQNLLFRDGLRILL